MRVAIREDLEVRPTDVLADIMCSTAGGRAVSVAPVGSEDDRWTVAIQTLDPLDDEAAAWLSGVQSGQATWLALSGGRRALMPTTDDLASAVDGAVEQDSSILCLQPRCLLSYLVDEPLDELEQWFVTDVMSGIVALSGRGDLASTSVMSRLADCYLPTWSRESFWSLRPVDPEDGRFLDQARWFVEGLTSYCLPFGDSGAAGVYKVFPSFVERYRRSVDRSLLALLPSEAVLAGDYLAAIWELPARIGRFGRYEQGFLSGVVNTLNWAFDDDLRSRMLGIVSGPQDGLWQPTLDGFLNAAEQLSIPSKPERLTAYGEMRAVLEASAGRQRADHTVGTLASIDPYLYPLEDREPLLAIVHTD